MATDEDIYLKDLRQKIRDTMQIVWLQFDIMNEVVDKCGDISHNTKYVHCANAIKMASKQIKIFQDRSNEMAVLISELSSYIKSKEQKYKCSIRPTGASFIPLIGKPTQNIY